VLNASLLFCIENSYATHIESCTGSTERHHKNHSQMLLYNMLILGLQGTETSRRKWPSLDAFFIEHADRLPPAPGPDVQKCSSQQLLLLAQQLQTNFYTGLWKNFFKRQKDAYDKVAEASGWDKRVHNNCRKAGNGEFDGLAQCYGRLVKTVTEGGRELNKISEQWLKKNPDVCLRKMYDLLRWREQNGLNGGFSLAPLPSLQRKNISFDRKAMCELLIIFREQYGEEIAGVLQHGGYTEKQICSLAGTNTIKQAKSELGRHAGSNDLGIALPGKGSKKVLMETWEIETLVGAKHKIGGERSKEFTGFIDTDGVSVSYHYKGLKMHGDVKERPQYLGEETPPKEKTCGTDPGRRALVTVAFDGNRFALTREQYRKRSHEKRNREKAQRTVSNETNRVLSRCPAKVHRLEHFMEHRMKHCKAELKLG